MSQEQRREMSKKEFSKFAKVAADDGCLKGRDGKYGTSFGILLNGHLMMSSEVMKDGSRKYFDHMN